MNPSKSSRAGRLRLRSIRAGSPSTVRRSMRVDLHHDVVSESGLLQAKSLASRPGANLDPGQFHTSTICHVRHNIGDV